MSSHPSSLPGGPSRRGFLAKGLAAIIGLGAYAVPALAALVGFLSPLRQKSQSGQFVRLASLSGLPEDGTPRRVPVIAACTDAWNRSSAEPIGAVWLRRCGDNRVMALHICCPHAGCPVAFDVQAKAFVCPCHTQPRFDLDGQRVEREKSHSPRDMDQLEAEVRNGAEIWVKFENFRSNTSERIART